MRRLAILCAALGAALLVSPRAGAQSHHSPHHRLGLILHDNTNLRAKPSTRSPVLAVLVEQTQVRVLATHGSWRHVQLWASVTGWVPKGEVVFRKPWRSVSTYHAPEVHYHLHAHAPATLHVRAMSLASVSLRTRPLGPVQATLQPGRTVDVTSWQQDSSGTIWYQVNRLWARGESIRFVSSDPGLTRSAGRPLWQRVAGKGMWLTLGPVADSDPRVLVSAALHHGVSHLYVESAISPLGFHGRDTVGPLIEEAHRHHISVIAWVYPYLIDLASDIDLTTRVAAFETTHGDHFDGIAADIERNMQLANVRAYSQIVRATLGPGYLLVGVTYPPQSIPGYPFAEMARSYNVLAPMDYWHQTPTASGLDYGHMRYGYDYGYRYAVDSVDRIRSQSGHVPVAPIGQAFDNFGRLEMGPNAPSASEVRGFLQGSKHAGAIGASFFQWMTATDAEWRAIHQFHF